MALVQTKDPRVVRDTETRALLVTDVEELYRNRRTRAKIKTLRSQQELLTDKFVAINSRLDRCESLLMELAQHISTLVAKYPSPSSERE